ncbi:MAG: AAA family ATPase [Caldilineaceae bacterium]|nr:AAA family ATPase [Caldilineaceae bacterium]
MSSTLLPTIISAKLFALPQRPDLVPRPHLTQRLMSGIRAGARVILISAPPGFGKSTSAAEIAAAVRAEGGSVAWLGLDPEDNDPTRFLVHLIAAVDQALPGIGEAAHARLEALVAEGIPSPPAASVLALLANSLNQAANQATEGRLLFVLDDYHLIEHPGLHYALAAWVEQLPPGVALLLCTRSDPPLPLARWRVRRQLLEVRVADLQFTAAETGTFFQQATQLSFPPDLAELAAARTEGWAAGLQLVALALEGDTVAAHDPAAWLEALGGDDRYIADYLVEEVLAHQPEPIQQFLLHTAVVDRLHGPLCDALLALPPGSGQTLLEEVERANLFLIPLDQRRQWYRYHHLFRDLLQRQLKRHAPEMVATLHQRAAQWYADQGLLDEGIEEALAGGVWDLAVEMLAASFPTVLRQGRWTTMRRWFATLPADRLVSSPRLCTWYAQMLIYTGEPAYALELLASAESGWRAEADLPGLAEALLVRMNLARLQDQPDEVRTIATQITSLKIPLSPLVQKTMACNVAIASQQAGDGRRALEQLTSFLTDTSQEEAPILVLLARSHLGDGYAALGDEEAARAAYQMVIDLTQGRNLFPLLRAHMGLAAFAAERGHWEVATHHAQEAIALAQSSERTLYTAPALLTLARVAASHNDSAGAERLAQQSMEMARTLDNTRQYAKVENWRAEAGASKHPTPGTPLTTVDLLLEPLTGREIEVLQLVAAGASNQQIAAQLVISLNTVKKHMANLLGKLQAESRTHALARARELGLIS